MRNLTIRLVLWLCRHYSISIIETARLRAGGDAIVRGAMWERFYREDGGLADMLGDIRREAFEAAAELDPKDTDKIYYWAMADRNVRKLQSRVEGIIIHGKAEASRVVELDRLDSGRILRSI